MTTHRKACEACNGTGLVPEDPAVQAALDSAHEYFKRVMQPLPVALERVPTLEAFEDMIRDALDVYRTHGAVYTTEPPHDSSRRYRDPEGDYWKWDAEDVSWCVRRNVRGEWEAVRSWAYITENSEWIPWTDVTHDPSVPEWARE